MKYLHGRRWVWAAVAAASLVSVPAMGQVRANQDGHAADANPRVGSGGINDSGGGGGRITGNDIVYGNVTGGGQFRGPAERDPRAFSGPSSQLLDRFIRSSAGAPAPYTPPSVGSDPQPFFGSSRFVPPPIGSERVGYTGTYVGTQYTPTNRSADALSSEIASSLDLQRQRTGENSILGSRTSNLLNSDVRSSDFAQPGTALDAQTQVITDTSSPLYGIRGTDPNSLTDADLPLYASPSLVPGGAASQRLTPSAVQKMRDELNNSPTLQDQPKSGTSGTNKQQPGGIQQPNLAQPLEGPQNAGFDASTGSSITNPNLTNGVGTSQSQQQRLTLVPARQQSRTLQELQDRFKQYENPQMTAIRTDVAQRNRIAAAAKARTASATGKNATTRPAAGGLGTGINLPPPPPTRVEPLKVPSLAEGMNGKGLQELLQSAEDLMRQDKFESAIERYNKAEDVAPNNGLIALGRANAELGAGYYRQANLDLHHVFQSEPALLMGQYDLKKWMNEKRLAFITKELTDLAVGDKKQEMPIFLLAYISYNTGQEGQAARYLNEARARAKSNDPLIDELEARWNLPAKDDAGKTPDLNK